MYSYAYRLEFPMSSGAGDNMRQPFYMTHPHHEGCPSCAFAPADQLARPTHPAMLILVPALVPNSFLTR